MDDRSFDALTKGLAQGRSRRSLLKSALGLGTAAIAGGALAHDTEAARRGYAGPWPSSTVVAGPQTCDPNTCYGCHQCVGGVCTDQPENNCNHMACKAASCAADGGCRYADDCRNGDNCCSADQTCNTDGVCVCKPNTCCGVTCPSCQKCVNDACIDDPAGSCASIACKTPFCQSGGECGYQDDCRNGDNCCGADQTCNADGVCVCKPNTCCGVTCPGCQVCVDGACVGDSSKCEDRTDQCQASACGVGGVCSYPFDCAVRDGCCTGGQVCNTQTGECESA